MGAAESLDSREGEEDIADGLEADDEDAIQARRVGSMLGKKERQGDGRGEGGSRGVIALAPCHGGVRAKTVGNA
jgi:hypothetical protein